MQYTQSLSNPVFKQSRAATALSDVWIPALSVVASVGILLVSFADTAARTNMPWAQPLFWIGLIALFVPMTLRILLAEVRRSETIYIVIYLGIALYLVKILHSPLSFTFFDELLHWRTADTIAVTGRLFSENALLPVSSFYPGLEIVTNALSTMSGLTIFQSGVIVIGIARLLMVLGLFLFFEEISQSTRIAAIGTILYMANPKFVFFDAQYAYESLALPLAVFVLFVIARRQRAKGAERFGTTIIAELGLLAITVTHHGTSFMLTVFLVGWAIVMWLKNRELQRTSGLTWIALFAIVINGAWWVGVAGITIQYFEPHIQHVVEAAQVMDLQAPVAAPIAVESSSAYATPLLERLIGIAAVGLPMVMQLYGSIILWKKYRTNSTMLFLGLGAVLFPLCVVLRLSGSGWEIGARLAAFAYIPLGFLLALTIEHIRQMRQWQFLYRAAIIMCVPIMIAGGVIAGWSPWERLPWPYHVVADARSVEKQGIDAAKWARTHLGSDNRMVADRTNFTLMGSYGSQRMISNLTDKVNISSLFLSPWMGNYELSILQTAQIRYVMVDRRVTEDVPLESHYYEAWEQLVVGFTPPVKPTVLDKYDTLKNVNRVFDSADIRLYDVGTFSHDQAPH